tara:strand:- start:5219 stop:5788 length:570 start_codon:yes stop_codon:yes gene_type:complete
MKNLKKFVLSFGVIGLLAGCLSDQDKANIEKVDQLIADTQEQLTALEATDYDAILVHHDTLFSNLGLLGRNLEDTVSKRLLVMLGDYRGMRKVYAKYKKSYPDLLAATKTEIEQLESLKKDIENDIVKEDKFEKYYQLEQNNVNTIIDKVGQITVKINRAEELYKDYAPAVDSLSAAVREKIKAKKATQ